MLRGFLSGVFWGVVFCGASLWVVSQISGVIKLLSPPEEVVQQVVPVDVAELPKPDESAAPAQAPDVPVSQPSSPALSLSETPHEPAPVADTTSATQPVADEVPAEAVNAPDNSDNAPKLPAPGERAAPSAPESPPSEPATDTAPDVPVQPQAVEQVTPETRTAPSAEVEAASAPVRAADSVVVSETSAPPVVPAAPDAAPVVPFNAPQVVETPRAKPTESAVETAEQQDVTPQPESPVQTAEAPAAQPQLAANDETQPEEGAPQPEQVAQVEAPASVAPTVTPEPASVVPLAPEAELPLAPEAELAPAPESARNADGTLVKPTVGFGNRKVATFGAAKTETDNAVAEQDVAASQAETTDGDGETGETGPTDDDIPALVNYARPFTNPDNLPMMSIILVTNPNGQITKQEEPLPFAVTYAMDASDDRAADLMDIVRGDDQEVLLMTPLPAGASPTDVETALSVYLSTVDEAVGLLDTPSADFQVNRDVASQVSAIAKDRGLGLVTYDRGLNSGLQVAERDGTPAALVFRQFDTGKQNGAAVKRFLDQAAFRAGQQKGVILVGIDRPETVKAILEWSLSNRANTVTFAPISVLLTDGQ